MKRLNTFTRSDFQTKARQACVLLRMLLSEIPIYYENVVCILISYFHKFYRKWPHFVFFDYKVSTKQHFEPGLFWKMPESWEFTHAWRALFQTALSLLSIQQFSQQWKWPPRINLTTFLKGIWAEVLSYMILCGYKMAIIRAIAHFLKYNLTFLVYSMQLCRSGAYMRSFYSSPYHSVSFLSTSV